MPITIDSDTPGTGDEAELHSLGTFTYTVVVAPDTPSTERSPLVKRSR